MQVERSICNRFFRNEGVYEHINGNYKKFVEFGKNLKKGLTKRASDDILNLASEEAGFSFSDSDEKEKINLKKLLTNEKACGNINKLSERKQRTTLITKQ